MGIFNEFYKKEKPVFTGITRGIGGFGFGKAAVASGGGGATFSGSGGVVSAGVEPGNGYKYHYFKSPGTFDVDASYGNAGGSTIDILVVAGGGSGGSRVGGGGGAGGIAWAQSIPIPTTTAGTSIPITVGNGGPAGGASPAKRGNTGDDSAFGDSPNPYYILTKGGGYGGGDDDVNGGAGGSGGGSEYGPADPGTGGPGIQPAQNPGKPWVTNYGNDGSYGAADPNWQSGAGGGAGSAATNGDQSNRGAAGSGQDFPTFSVSLYMPAPDPYWPGISPLPGTSYGGGGGAGDYPPFISQNMPSGATNGGGGIGGPSSAAGSGTPGVNGLGGGGGGGSGQIDGPVGGVGGNGIVVIRYSV